MARAVRRIGPSSPTLPLRAQISERSGISVEDPKDWASRPVGRYPVTTSSKAATATVSHAPRREDAFKMAFPEKQKLRHNFFSLRRCALIDRRASLCQAQLHTARACASWRPHRDTHLRARHQYASKRTLAVCSRFATGSPSSFHRSEPRAGAFQYDGQVAVEWLFADEQRVRSVRIPLAELRQQLECVHQAPRVPAHCGLRL